MRVLFVAMAASIHAARWISQLEGTGWDIHVFDTFQQTNTVSDKLRNVTLHRGWYAETHPSVNTQFRWPFRRGNTIIPAKFPKLAHWIVPDTAKRLAEVIKKIDPDCVHAMSMTHSVYYLDEAFKILGRDDIPWIYSSMGSDLYFFGQNAEHRTRMTDILIRCRNYISNNERDVRLAHEFGFEGTVLAVLPGPGGYNINEMLSYRQLTPPSGRRVIAIKGLQNWAGRALAAVEAIERVPHVLRDFEVVVFSPHPVVLKRIENFNAKHSTTIQVIKGRHNPVEEIWKLLGRSRVYIGVSLSDGIPNTMLEAMVMGAFPIQTNPGGVTHEWIDEGINGITVPHDDPECISEAIRRATSDDELVDSAAEINAQRITERIDIEHVRPRVIEIYRHVAHTRT